jgi:SpoVK/Ycf46/Vps4 family AAA+-type ATPase
MSQYNKNIFYTKIAINALMTWKGNFSDDNLMKTLVESRFPLHDIEQQVGWRDAISKMDEAHRAEYETSVSFPIYSKFINIDTIERMIVQPMVNLCPELDDDFPIDPTVRTIAELLELDENETTFLQYCAHMVDLDYPFDSSMTRIIHGFSQKPLLIASILNIPLRDAENILDGFLVKSGFVIPSKYPEGSFSISPNYEKIFETTDITFEQVDTILFPNNVSSTLTLEDYPHITNDVSRVVDVLRDGLGNKTRGTNVMLWGPAGTGKTELAITLAKENGWDLKVIGDISDIDTQEKSRADRLGNLKIAMKLFANSDKTILLFDEIEDLFKTDANATFSKAFINRIIETTPIPIIWTTNSLTAVGSPVLRRMTYNIHCKTPDKLARRRIWSKYASEYEIDYTDIADLDHYDISPALIKNATRMAKIKGTFEDIDHIVKSLDTLVNYGAERKFNSKPAIVDHYDVKCINADIDMQGFTNRIISTDTSAFALCLYGPPGTGKSEYARYLARQMGKDVVFKRASDLVSCWLGVTEQNIAAAFEEARLEKAMLIIDEGDSFFQNRENAKASWEISQVNEILSQMEKHPEPFVITTNLMDNLDPAALRRFTFKVKFNFLKGDQAARLFNAYYGVDAPMRILRNDIITPGDIACVEKQVKVLGIRDGEEIYQMIERECELKPNHRKSIGF